MSGTISTSSLDAATTGDQRVAPAGPWIIYQIGGDGDWVVSNSLGGSFDLFRKTQELAVAARDNENAKWREKKIRDAGQDLLDACKDCLEGRGDWVALMTAAIAKAEGR